MKKLAIITARGGSKRIPGKNIKKFCGKPIMAYSIMAALKSGLFDEVMVSTDSEEIAEIAKQYGASVPFMRSVATSNDYATTSDVLLEVLHCYKNMGKEYDIACCLYPTAPFVSVERLKEAYKLLSLHMELEECLAVFPVVDFSFPPQRAVYVNEGNVIEKVQPELYLHRSQDLRKMYHDVGQFYMFNVQKYLRNPQNGLIDDTSRVVVVSEMECQDIDTETDWKLAEIKYKMINGIDDQEGE